MSGPGNILIRVGGETGGAVRELHALDKPLGDVQTRGQKMGAGIRRASVPAVAALAAITAGALSAAKAAAEDEAAAVKLAGGLDRTTSASAAAIAATDDWISKLSIAKGVSDDELRPALAKLAAATGSLSQGQKDLGLALDISAQTGKSVEAVSKALAGAYDGKTAALSRLVPGLDQATLKSKDMAAITAELADKVGGASAEAAQTAEGKYRRMQIQLSEAREEIGAQLIPVVSKLTSAVSAATAAAASHTTAAKIVVGVVAALAAGVLVARAAMAVYQAGTVAVRVATAAWSAAQWLVNAALTANPIGIVVVAAAALAVGIVVLYKKSETFRGAVQTLWSLLKLSPLGIVISHFDELAGAVQRVVGWISQIHWPSPPSWLGKIGGILGSVIPGAARTAARATARRTSSRSTFPRGASSSPRGAGPFGAGGLGSGITINVYGATDPEGTARAIRRTLRGHERRQGGLHRLGAATA